MTHGSPVPSHLPTLNGWALVLGASSGFGEAVSTTLARAGCNVIGVHLDRRATMTNVERIVGQIKAHGREAWFFNVNAADPDKRAEVCEEIAQRFRDRGKGESLRVFLHSLAFGTLRPFIAETLEQGIQSKQLDMTLDVMANSLVYWTQDLLHRALIGSEGRIFAMTSTGAWSVWPGYGPVSAAKAALEAHVRQLACELSPRGITVNAVCAGVTDTPALRKIPDNEGMVEVALRKNPTHRLTRVEDVAYALAALAQPATYWMTGNVINVDGGEAIAG